MSTHNIGFYEEISKLSLNYHQISSNMHLISPPDKRNHPFLQDLERVFKTLHPNIRCSTQNDKVQKGR